MYYVCFVLSVCVCVCVYTRLYKMNKMWSQHKSNQFSEGKSLSFSGRINRDGLEFVWALELACLVQIGILALKLVRRHVTFMYLSFRLCEMGDKTPTSLIGLW